MGKKAKGGREEGWFRPPPSVGTTALQGDKCKRLLFGFISTFSVGRTRTLSPKMKHLYFSIVLEDVALEHAGVQTAQMVMVPKWPIDWFTCSPRSRMGFRQVLQRSL